MNPLCIIILGLSLERARDLLDGHAAGEFFHDAWPFLSGLGVKVVAVTHHSLVVRRNPKDEHPDPPPPSHRFLNDSGDEELP